MNQTREIEEILLAAERKCYYTTVANFPSGNNTGTYCERFFDGLMCWPRTFNGQMANQSCSNEFIKATGTGYATRQCTASGEWYVPDNVTDTISWTNYTECGQFFIAAQQHQQLDASIYITWLPIIKNISHFGYVCSIIALLFALCVFIGIKRLHCSRNRLHINLFVSFVMRAVMSLLKDALFVKGTALTYDTIFIDGEPTFNKEEHYSWVCKAIISLQHYFIVSNYMFLLMEGTYLHNLIFLNLLTENGVTIYCLFGWCLPIVFIGPWIVLKCTQEDIFCWTQKQSKWIAWLIELPIAATINFVLFLIIIRVLFVKLTSMYIQQRRLKYRKLLKATLILVPLFGIPYTVSIILGVYVNENQTLEVLWLFFDQTFTAFQGVFASLVYCLLNGEVQVEIRRKYNSLKDRKQRDIFGGTGGLSLSQIRRNRTISNTQQTTINNTPMMADDQDISIQNLHVKNAKNSIRTTTFF